MDDSLNELFNNFDRGTISRRRLLQALGLAAVTAPAVAWAQGRCGGANAGTPGCDTTPAKAPFDPTGWKTIALDHFTLQVARLQERSGLLFRADELEAADGRRQQGRARHRRFRQRGDSRRLRRAAAAAASGR